MRSSVDLPAPFSPTIACASPSSTEKAHAAQRLYRAERLVDVVELEPAHAAVPKRPGRPAGHARAQADETARHGLGARARPERADAARW